LAEWGSTTGQRSWSGAEGGYQDVEVMSFEKTSSLLRKEKDAGQTREEDREIAERKDWRRVSAARSS
uniref:hypothetical protein n=1 Tax=Salmonella enterica TaxID=28901 RepID=UPI001BAF4319